jgi:hypothetical protein
VGSLATVPSQGYFEVTAGPQTYAFSFCGNLVGALCGPAGAQYPTGSMALKSIVGGCLQSYGLATNASATLLASDPTQGVTVTYAGGPQCSDLSTAYTVINLVCDRTTPATVVGARVLQQDCAIEVNLRSAAACPYAKARVVTPLGGGYIALIVIVSALSLYCVAGVGWKRYRSGASGIEAVPHIDSLRKAYAAAARLVGRVTGRGGAGGGDGYYVAAGGDVVEDYS